MPRRRLRESGPTLYSTVSTLIVQNPSLVTGRRHIEMVFANLGEGIGGSWRDEVGRLAYAEVIYARIRTNFGRGRKDR